ncbi:MAG: hypothetical protein ACRDVC_10870 [Acidimicrobiales bacterium]
MRRLCLVLPVVVTTLASWSASAWAASTTSPQQILELSVSAMHSEGSFHYDSSSSIAGVVALTLSTDSALTKGDQTQSLDGGTETTRLIGKKLYLYANAKAYSADFGVKKTTLANEWVLVPSTNKNYGNIAAAILVRSVMQQLVDIGSVKDVGAVTIDGQSALALQGDAGQSGTETVYVSTKAPYLPIGVSALAVVNGRKITNELVFSKWGEKFSVKAPSTYVVATNKTFP